MIARKEKRNDYNDYNAGRMPSCHPTNSIEALKGKQNKLNNK